ncbi:hypothetical protein FBU30_002428 [Linnemannia zychae]|nr:hypothetical protein FBU30_002428 [Linnemannia zychae]
MDNNDINTAYMNMINRNIPGVGANPIIPSTPITSAAIAIPSDSTLTQNQRNAIDTLRTVVKDAFFVSEGEEPYQVVYIPASPATSASTAANTSAMISRAFPTGQEFIDLLHAAQLLPESDHQQVQENKETNICERSSNLQSVLSTSNPGSDKIAHALYTIFGYQPPALSSDAAVSKNEDSKVMLYRIEDPSSSTRVHIWVLGWIDGDLIGIHTLSIES